MANEQRYTLTLPTELYEEVCAAAASRGISIREAVRQCLRAGMIAREISERPDTELLIREQRPDGSEHDTLLRIV